MKKILVTQSSMPPFDEYVNEIRDIWDSHWLTNMGPKHNLLEEELKKYLGVNNLSLFVNGHNALELLLQAMELKGEIITTPFTFISTTHAIVRNGIKPVFCDIDPLTYCIDANKIESLITDRTTAILPVHVYGNVCNVEKIDIIAKKYGLKVIYDAAHAFGVKYKGKGIGTYGDASMFSFHATKVFHTIEGGAICYNNENIGQILYKLRDFGIKDSETVDCIGSNAKMNEFSSAMGLCGLRHITDEIAKRKNVVEYYRNELTGVNGITIPIMQDSVTPNYAYFPIVVDETQYGITRDDLYKVLSDNNIFARKYFYPLTSQFDCYQGLFDSTQTPVAISISDRVLTLPLYSNLDIQDVNRICSIIKNSKK